MSRTETESHLVTTNTTDNTITEQPFLEALLDLPTQDTKKTQDVRRDERIYTYDSDYVEKNLFDYIGNKRRLLDLIIASVKYVEENGQTVIDRQGFFIDFFSGTGVVSRMAKSLGFSVLANDWEYYSYCINRGFLEMNKSDLSIFDDEGGLKKVLDTLNSLRKEVAENSYIAEYYCPKNDLAPDVEKERMFYSHQNGVLIDNIRAEIDRRYPAGKSEMLEKKRTILLALLLIQASKRSNTSGVFKGFHQGFGGKKGDSLGRILAPVKLEMPQLHDDLKLKGQSSKGQSSKGQSSKAQSSKAQSVKVFSEDALQVAENLRNLSAEIAYLDPPYNQHQYGSNYHLLNTIAKNDQPPIDKSFWINGKKVRKSGIREDWKKTKSSFCYDRSALQDFSKLINSINAKYILVSYSDEGIIPLEEMINTMAGRGKISVVTFNYVRYRGGRQANTTANKNVEFVLTIETALQSSKDDISRVQETLFRNKLNLVMEDFFPVHLFDQKKITRLDNQDVARGVVKSMREQGIIEEKATYQVKITLPEEQTEIDIFLNDKLNILEHSKEWIHSLSLEEKREFYREIQLLKPQTNHEKVLDLITLMENHVEINRNHFLKEMVRFYNKVDKKKESLLFAELTGRLLQFNRDYGYLQDCQTAWTKFERAQM